MITKNLNRIFCVNSRVYFTLQNGGTKIVRMSPSSVAHLVADFVKKSSSIFKEDFTCIFAGETIHYSAFKIKVDGDKDFALEYSVN